MQNNSALRDGWGRCTSGGSVLASVWMSSRTWATKSYGNTSMETMA